jgi:hypothetical protein
MSPTTKQNTDASTPGKGNFMSDVMKAMAISAEKLETISSKLRNAIEDDTDQTILQADVLRATAELVGLVVRTSRILISSLVHTITDQTVPP